MGGKTLNETTKRCTPGGSLESSMYEGVHPIFWGKDSRCDSILLGGFPVTARYRRLLHSITPL